MPNNICFHIETEQPKRNDQQYNKNKMWIVYSIEPTPPNQKFKRNGSYKLKKREIIDCWLSLGTETNKPEMELNKNWMKNGVLIAACCGVQYAK